MPLEMKHFVLFPWNHDDHGRASRQAMRAYARSICYSDPELADQLKEWADTAQGNQLNDDSVDAANDAAAKIKEGEG